MKPKNKFQQQIVEASSKLPKITQVQKNWALQNCLEHIARRTSKGVITCCECGHSWKGTGYLVDTLTDCLCPNCSTKLTVKTTRQRIFKQIEYFGIITVCKGFQVLRFFHISSYFKTGEKAHYSICEVVQRWIAPNGKNTTIALLHSFSYYFDTWLFSSSLEIRKNKHEYNINPSKVYPRQKLIPELKRSGYKGDFYNISPFDLFYFLLTENKAETLIKAGQTELLRYFVYNSNRNINDYWQSIRICIRNGYNVTNETEWCDYIDLLRFFGKDLHNAKYTCPADLNAEHDRYVEKKREYIKREDAEKAKRKALENENKFKELKAKFFGIQFSDGLIHVRVLESVMEIMQEGDTMHHCVFTNNYHLRPDSLILSAYTDEKKLETIEVSLSKLKVTQCRGLLNENTQYHNRILSLVNRNIALIQKRLAS